MEPKSKPIQLNFKVDKYHFYYSCGLSNETIEYLSACVCVTVCLCVCKHDNSKIINLGT